MKCKNCGHIIRKESNNWYHLGSKDPVIADSSVAQKECRRFLESKQGRTKKGKNIICGCFNPEPKKRVCFE